MLGQIIIFAAGAVVGAMLTSKEDVLKLRKFKQDVKESFTDRSAQTNSGSVLRTEEKELKKEGSSEKTLQAIMEAIRTSNTGVRVTTPTQPEDRAMAVLDRLKKHLDVDFQEGANPSTKERLKKDIEVLFETLRQS